MLEKKKEKKGKEKATIQTITDLNRVLNTKKKSLFYMRLGQRWIPVNWRKDPHQDGEILETFEPRLPNQAFPDELQIFL